MCWGHGKQFNEPQRRRVTESLGRIFAASP
jgi:hypothetical protein